MKHAFLTGATGFIGHHLAKLLLKRGVRVTALARDPSRLNNLPVDTLKGDITLPGTLNIPPDVDTVFHLAGLTKARKRQDYFDVNARGTENLLTAVKRDTPNAHFVYMSSLAAIGPSPSLADPVTEDTAPHPVSSYGESKLAGEKHALASGLSLTIIRPPAVFGEGEKDIFMFIQMANRGVSLYPGFAERWFSLVYGPDLCLATVELTEKFRGETTAFFVAYPQFFSWKQFREAVAETLGKRVRTIRFPLAGIYPIALIQEMISFFNRKPALLNLEKCREIVAPYWTCDVSRIQNSKILPATPFPQALEQTVQWYRNNNWL
ncbi:MAG: NAD-dependent epimerase/dehydratase family protein [Acidobacteria bacterium]|nr:NAD-dependent epimerase/dehydratase family protein [Acidobacteriota bacterium]